MTGGTPPGLGDVFGGPALQVGPHKGPAGLLLSVCQEGEAVLAAHSPKGHDEGIEAGCHAHKLLPLRPEQLVLLPLVLVRLHRAGAWGGVRGVELRGRESEAQVGPG